MQRGIILAISGVALLIFGNLIIPLVSPSNESFVPYYKDRSAYGTLAVDEPFSHKVWFYENEHVSGYVSTNDTLQPATVQIISPDGQTIFEKSFKRYQWMEFDTAQPPGEYTMLVTNVGKTDMTVTIHLNIAFEIDPISREIFREKAFLPKLANLIIGPIIDIGSTLVIGVGCFLFLSDRKKTVWQNHKILLIGGLIFAVGFSMFYDHNDYELVNFFVDYSTKTPIPQDLKNADSNFYYGWIDYFLLILLPYLVMFAGIVITIIGGIKSINKITRNRKPQIKQTQEFVQENTNQNGLSRSAIILMIGFVQLMVMSYLLLAILPDLEQFSAEYSSTSEFDIFDNLNVISILAASMLFFVSSGITMLTGGIVYLVDRRKGIKFAVRKNEPVSIKRQTVYAVIPMLDMYAAFKVGKFWMYILIIIGIVVATLPIDEFIFSNEEPYSTLSYYSIVLPVAIFLIRLWSKKWNEQFSPSLVQQ